MASVNIKGKTGIGSLGTLVGLGTAVVSILGLIGLYSANFVVVGVLIAGLGLMLYGSIVDASSVASLPWEGRARLGGVGLGVGSRSALQAGGRRDSSWDYWRS